MMRPVSRSKDRTNDLVNFAKHRPTVCLGYQPVSFTVARKMRLLTEQPNDGPSEQWSDQSTNQPIDRPRCLYFLICSLGSVSCPSVFSLTLGLLRMIVCPFLTSFMNPFQTNCSPTNKLLINRLANYIYIYQLSLH